MLTGGEARKRGRPKGSTNRRAKDLKGFIDGRYGASAAQQSAAVCMVTPAELKAAGGSMARAQVEKALDLVRHVREAKDRLDGELRDLVRQAVAELAKGSIEVKAFIDRIEHLGGSFGLPQAMKMLADERAALLPYTDQRQPLAVDVTGKGMAPSVVLMGAAPMADLGAMGVEKAEVFEGIFTEVSPPKSHGEGQALEQLQFLGPEPAD